MISNNKYYTIKSTSNDGVYYLVCNWRKYKTFWMTEKDILKDTNRTFTKLATAKASLTKLLNITDDDYSYDTFEPVEICNGRISKIN